MNIRKGRSPEIIEMMSMVHGDVKCKSLNVNNAASLSEISVSKDVCFWLYR